MKVLFAGGGTGGHIYPALALARYLREKEGADVLFVGTARGMEAQIVPAEGFPLELVPVEGLTRRISLKLGRALYLAGAAVFRSRRLLKRFQPDVVVGTGGYVAGPVVLAAWLAGIPTVIHEQNVIPGLTNVWLSRLASCVCLSFPGSEKYFPNRQKTVLTGNPRATDAYRAAGAPPPAEPLLDDRRPVLLCVSGSQGAARINEAFSAALEAVLASCQVQVVYITGRRYFAELSIKLSRLQQRYRTSLHLLPYHAQLPMLLARTSLMVSRAGATTLAEVTTLGVPSILIPSPNVTSNHQEHNARLLADKGAAVLIKEEELSAAGLATLLVELLSDRKRLAAMAQASKALGVPDAAARMAAVISSLCRR
ncbi:MAG: undecaprenyldiphospho-muramoylpentapeptide beta-N-acetylglucosaminyltransferase [Firmicutes bacterium]|nr:undecaprenyldiphospho-muramoylpentapeptide beta-N-acetylglucosaminyltransferase [Bacillota bacterium]